MATYTLILVASLLVLALFREELRKFQFARKTWGELLSEVSTVNIEGITLAALECNSHVAFDPDDVWTMIGGWNGLKQMQANAHLLIALASHATQWNSEACAEIAEQMRSDAREIHNAVRRIRWQRLFGKGTSLFSSDTLGTVCAYYRMSECLITLFERSPSRRYGQLTAAVWPVLVNG